MWAALSSETLVNFYHTTRRHKFLTVICVTISNFTHKQIYQYVCVILLSEYEVLPKNSGNLNSAPEPVAVYPSAARCD
jgi:hypothetical protein